MTAPQLHSSYSLVVEAKDLDGKEHGNGQVTSLQIKILDVNDNIPKLNKSVVSKKFACYYLGGVFFSYDQKDVLL